MIAKSKTACAVIDAEITKECKLELAEQERRIVVQQVSEGESRGRAGADLARAQVIKKTTKAMATARDVAEAERTE